MHNILHFYVVCYLDSKRRFIFDRFFKKSFSDISKFKKKNGNHFMNIHYKIKGKYLLIQMKEKELIPQKLTQRVYNNSFLARWIPPPFPGMFR